MLERKHARSLQNKKYKKLIIPVLDLNNLEDAEELT